MHVPYENIAKHPPDFRVSYRFYDFPEGRRTMPCQGYRSDFGYYNSYYMSQLHKSHVFMIWPEFEDSNGDIILDTSIPVNASGTALMWIINPAMRIRHQSEIHLGILGYFMEGPVKVAECRVIEIIALMSNPI